MRRPVLILLAIAILSVVLLTAARLHGGDGQAVAIVDETPAPTRSPEPLIVVDVTGAIARPGVYRLPAGSRTVDALLAAGGMTGEADLDALNKAAPIHDGQRIYVPRPGETVPSGSAGSDAQLKIDVNRATAAELEALPGIGPTTAARIVRSRGSHPFGRVEELQTRGLVTARVFADIKDMVAVR
ncbi:MAG: ComEA family DNA-binding protein [Chloroflexi bacterium]|nr:MAG: ComEA family DNA-binding protein [Chloroflexota bacterium]TMG63573.1 MAG: ComEA family DNA-binding protein [Chloroflexota bacterium]